MRVPRVSPENVGRSFSNLMFQGKVREVISLLSNQDGGGVLNANDYLSSSNQTTVLKSKHLQGQPPIQEALII